MLVLCYLRCYHRERGNGNGLTNEELRPSRSPPLAKRLKPKITTTLHTSTPPTLRMLASPFCRDLITNILFGPDSVVSKDRTARPWLTLYSRHMLRPARRSHPEWLTGVGRGHGRLVRESQPCRVRREVLCLYCARMPDCFAVCWWVSMMLFSPWFL
jgi:hypothetical protein